MPSSDYTASSGALKFKGSAGVTKPKKKKAKKPATAAPEGLPTSSKADAPSDERAKTDLDVDSEAQAVTTTAETDVARTGGTAKAETGKTAETAKTAAEMRYQESRRRRLDERLRREGARTHKERVEELNRYLSGLSEHHDMCVLSFGCFCGAILTSLQAPHWSWLRLLLEGRAFEGDTVCR